TAETINDNIRKQEEEKKKRKQEEEEEGEGKKGGPIFSWAKAYRITTRPASLKKKKDEDSSTAAAAAVGFSTKGRELWERLAVSPPATAVHELLHANNNNYVAENSWEKEE
ncbi:hypothetical protein FOZ63_012583, partial [Perkinsus olseni]